MLRLFPVSISVRQGGIPSPILFCIYFDDLISKLIEVRVGCFIGQVYVGVLLYADDVAKMPIIAPTPLDMQKILNICDTYANEYSIKFSSNKSKCMYYPAVPNSY
jgi:hypothetical protein